MKINTQIFGIAENSGDCVAGTLETMTPIAVGHTHRIKGRMWECYKVGVNIYGKTIADFKLITPK